MIAPGPETAAIAAITAALRQELPVLPAGTARKLAARLWSVGEVAQRMELDDWLAKRRREDDLAKAAADVGEALRRQRGEADAHAREALQRAVRLPSGRAAHVILGCEPGASAAAIAAAFRARAKACHPDHGGSTEMMAELNAARDALLRASGPAQPQSQRS